MKRSVKKKPPIEFPMFEDLGLNYEIEEVDVLDLKLNGNPILNIVALSIPNYYKEESRRFNHIEIPVVTKDNLVLTHKTDIEVAILLKKEKIKIQRVSNLNENQYIRFSLKSVCFFELCAEQRFELIKLLTNHLNNVDIEWGKELTRLGFEDIVKEVKNENGDIVKDAYGKNLTNRDINAKLGYLLRCDKETVKAIKRNGEQAEIKRQVLQGLIPEPVKPVKKERLRESIFEIPSLKKIPFGEIAISFSRKDLFIQIDAEEVKLSFYTLKENNGLLCIEIPLTDLLPFKSKIA